MVWKLTIFPSGATRCGLAKTLILLSLEIRIYEILNVYESDGTKNFIVTKLFNCQKIIFILQN